MARTRYIDHGLEELKSLPGVELGLHFDLTYDRATPGQLLWAWVRPGANRKALVQQAREELGSQLAVLGRHGIEPRYMDGHQHIHLIPGLLDGIAEPLHAAGIHQIRLPYDPGLWFTPKAPINLLSRLARSKLKKHGFVSLPCFYPQAAHFRDSGKLRARLSRDPDTEVIVHPSRQDDFAEFRIPDPYSTGRVLEFQALRMLAWIRPSSDSAGGGRRG